MSPEAHRLLTYLAWRDMPTKLHQFDLPARVVLEAHGLIWPRLDHDGVILHEVTDAGRAVIALLGEADPPL